MPPPSPSSSVLAPRVELPVTDPRPAKRFTREEIDAILARAGQAKQEARTMREQAAASRREARKMSERTRGRGSS